MRDNSLAFSRSGWNKSPNWYLATILIVVAVLSVTFLTILTTDSLIKKLLFALIPLALGAGSFLLAQIIFQKSSKQLDELNNLFMGYDSVLLLTSKTGLILQQNNLSARHFNSNSDLTDVFANSSDDPKATIYKLLQDAQKKGKSSFLLKNNTDFNSVSIRSSNSGIFLWSFSGNDFKSNTQVNAQIAQVQFSSDGEIVWMNAKATELFGNERQELLELISDKTLKSDQILSFASLRDTQFRTCVIAGENETTEILFLPTDVEEMSGWLADQFLDDLPVALARINSDGAIDYVNNAARLLLGDRAIPGTKLSLIIEGMGRSFKERLAETMRGREQGRSEVARGRIDDREVFLQVTLSRIVRSNEAFVLAILSDATELKTLEAQFVQSQKMQAVGQLAGGVAHDFNNLLTAINGHCDLMLLRHDSSDTDHADLMQIRQNANRAAALVRQLLAFSRKQTLRPKVLHLFDSLTELTHLLNRLLGEKVKLTIDHDADLFPVRVDVRQLEQVVMNLVVNARDAMPNGGVVHLRTRCEILEGDMVRDRATVPMGRYSVIEVSDTGMGIPRDQLAKVFEPFYTTKKVGEGTGLGLSTAYGIIKQTGGFIFVDSTPDVGTTFNVYLPAFDEDAPKEVADVAEEVEAPVSDLSGRGVILLVEDEAPVRSFGARALTLRGYTVLEAESGEQALDILKDETLHIDLFVSDVVMPGLNGPSWVKIARTSRPDVPTIFVSGYAEDAFKDGNSEIPNTSFLAKPFTLNELTENVKEKMVDVPVQ